MRILKVGKIPPDPMEMWAEKRCGNCGTVVEFQRKEVQSGGRPGETPELYVTCPLCKKSHAIGEFEFFPREDKNDNTGRELGGVRGDGLRTHGQNEKESHAIVGR